MLKYYWDSSAKAKLFLIYFFSSSTLLEVTLLKKPFISNTKLNAAEIMCCTWRDLKSLHFSNSFLLMRIHLCKYVTLFVVKKKSHYFKIFTNVLCHYNIFKNYKFLCTKTYSDFEIQGSKVLIKCIFVLANKAVQS